MRIFHLIHLLLGVVLYFILTETGTMQFGSLEWVAYTILFFLGFGAISRTNGALKKGCPTMASVAVGLCIWLAGGVGTSIFYSAVRMGEGGVNFFLIAFMSFIGVFLMLALWILSTVIFDRSFKEVLGDEG